MNLCEDTTEVVVFDSETLGRWDDSIILSVAATHGDLSIPFSVEQLIEERTFFMKFSATEQRKAGRQSQQAVIDWWKSNKVSDEARAVSLRPTPDDVSMLHFVPEYIKWAHKMLFEPKKVIHTDRNLFDLSKLQHMIEMTLGQESHEPWHYHNIIDVTSTLRAWGADRYAGIDIRKLNGVVYHDPRYDAAIDWLRLQATAKKLGILEVKESV